MTTVPLINLPTLVASFVATDGRVKYQLGAKPAPDAVPTQVHESDCSGYTRWLIYRATGGKLELPEGSFGQHQWCETAGLHKLGSYSDVQYASEDNSRLFICFITPDATEKIGHVWLVHDGSTIECYGDHGVGSRSWDVAILKDNCSAAYELITATT